jgi:long-chain acyl-CoA synthetase
MLDTLVGRTLRAQFGGRLRLAVSGGAPLSATIARCFLGLGVPILQGYGMTETSPVVAANAPEDNDPATVGRPVRDVEVRIGDNQELLVRGPNVMKGYWKREEDTAATFIDGWLRTGDQAAIEHGRVRILGRVKEIIVTSTGEKIAPVDLELAITGDPLFEQVYALGDNRPFIACIVQLNREEWQHWAAQQGWDATAPGTVQMQPVREALLARIRELTKAFPHYAQPRAVWPVLEPWTIEGGLITPTLKLKRKQLAAHYREQIEALYQR